MKRIYFLLVLALLIAANGFAATVTDRFGRDVKIINKETNAKKPVNECAYINSTLVIPLQEDAKQTQTISYDKQHNTFFVTIYRGKKIVGTALHDMYGGLIRRFPAPPMLIRYNANSVVAKQQKDTTKTIQVLAMSINEYNGHKCLDRANGYMNTRKTDALRLYKWAVDLGCPLASKSTLANLYYEVAIATNNQPEYYQYMDESARLGKVEAMEALIENYTQKAIETSDDGKAEQFLFTALDWATVAYNEGSAVGAYWLGRTTMARNEVDKARSYLEYAVKNGYQPANELLAQLKAQVAPTPIKWHLPQEMITHLDDLSVDDLGILAHKGYREAMEYYCRKKLFFDYSLTDIYLADVTDALYGRRKPDPEPLGNKKAMDVLPVLSAIAPTSPAAKFMLACCLSDKRCFGVVFDTEKEHAFVDMKKAHQLAREYLLNPAPEGNEPWGLKPHEVTEMAENILGYDANYQRPAPTLTTVKEISKIPTYAQILATKTTAATKTASTTKPVSTTTTTPAKNTTTPKSTTTTASTARTIEQLINYPMGQLYLPKNGEGMLTYGQGDRFEKTVKDHVSWKYKYGIVTEGKLSHLYSYSSDGFDLKYDVYPIYETKMVFSDNSQFSHWEYDIKFPQDRYTYDEVQKIYNRIIQELNALGLNMHDETIYGDLTKINKQGRLGGKRVDAELKDFKSIKAYYISIDIHPKWD